MPCSAYSSAVFLFRNPVVLHQLGLPGNCFESYSVHIIMTEHKHGITTAWHKHSMATAWPQHDHSMATAWPQHGHSMATARPCGHSMITAWPQHDHSMGLHDVMFIVCPATCYCTPCCYLPYAGDIGLTMSACQQCEHASATPASVLC